MNKIASKIPLIARLFLGLIFLFSGLNGFFQFAPMPELPPPAAAFLAAVGSTGYLFPMIMSLEVVAGAALLADRFVPFALILLAPIVVNIAAFHLVLTPGQAGMSVVLVIATAFLGWSYRGAYRSLFSARIAPDVSLARRELSRPALRSEA